MLLTTSAGGCARLRMHCSQQLSPLAYQASCYGLHTPGKVAVTNIKDTIYASMVPPACCDCSCNAGKLPG